MGGVEIFKNTPLKIFKQGGASPVRRIWIRLWSRVTVGHEFRVQIRICSPFFQMRRNTPNKQIKRKHVRGRKHALIHITKFEIMSLERIIFLHVSTCKYII